ncbi:hypothetical protein GOHSU_08_00550 [Gordonia hirsuta DSM 44140 = NBRC 16056]|uniref:Uncharacterized protein n=1 Tax=Gordonia hirsuta DSM 44140 = NBRC 16056 TaxID=1121927 RepID=L7L919_9ACTN|nr:hypothetical protein [Gordonia hirsuta]GAC56527.1 hypothetical protein GOHSU_08_00550 [Gordonia hirsuta DSM 44140 = NBRC 16056]
MPSAPPINLLPGETVIRHQDFTPRLILTYLKTTMILTNRRLVVSSPNTIFGIIPHGYSIHSAPIETITDAGCGNGRQTGAISMVGSLFAVLLVVGAFVMFVTIAGGGTF